MSDFEKVLKTPNNQRLSKIWTFVKEYSKFFFQSKPKLQKELSFSTRPTFNSHGQKIGKAIIYKTDTHYEGEGLLNADNGYAEQHIIIVAPQNSFVHVPEITNHIRKQHIYYTVPKNTKATFAIQSKDTSLQTVRKNYSNVENFEKSKKFADHIYIPQDKTSTRLRASSSVKVLAMREETTLHIHILTPSKLLSK